jgi:hypothetical protein
MGIRSTLTELRPTGNSASDTGQKPFFIKKNCYISPTLLNWKGLNHSRRHAWKNNNTEAPAHYSICHTPSASLCLGKLIGQDGGDSGIFNLGISL